jgi:Zinc carboxypeptidase
MTKRGAAMEYRDVKQLEPMILQLAERGAQLHVIGQSTQGRPLYSVMVGNAHATSTLLLVAGMHANEIIGSLAAVAFLQQVLAQPMPHLRIACIPLADPDTVAEMVQNLPDMPDLRAILTLGTVRDLEGTFPTDTYIECTYIRQWLASLGTVDVYVALHTAHRIAPGLFFYIGNTLHPTRIACLHQYLTTTLPAGLPKAATDPTGLATNVLAEGLFEIPLTRPIGTDDEPIGASLGYVQTLFKPRCIAVTEIPLGISSALQDADLSTIEQYNRDYATNGITEQPFAALPVDIQVTIATTFIRALLHCTIDQETTVAG